MRHLPAERVSVRRNVLVLSAGILSRRRSPFEKALDVNLNILPASLLLESPALCDEAPVAGNGR